MENTGNVQPRPRRVSDYGHLKFAKPKTANLVIYTARNKHQMLVLVFDKQQQRRKNFESWDCEEVEGQGGSVCLGAGVDGGRMGTGGGGWGLAREGV